MYVKSMFLRFLSQRPNAYIRMFLAANYSLAKLICGEGLKNG
jgi:hypothetical protein